MTNDVVGRFADRNEFCHLSVKPTQAHTTVRRTPRASSPGGSERIMSPTRIPNSDLDDLPADPREAELEMIIEASTLRLQSLVLVQASFDDESEIAYAEEEA